MSKEYGYIRVSSCDQNEDRQMIALKELNIPDKNIYLDKQSGKDFERPQYRKLMRKLKKDDLAISGFKQTVLRSKTDAMRSERTNFDYRNILIPYND